ncbi:hypothetical protein [Micromonospora parva]|uniref:hypothetical protein n=1 Tax=Micromonospora parva TaxID=1464048 RepID=UPI0033CE331F
MPNEFKSIPRRVEELLSGDELQGEALDNLMYRFLDEGRNCDQKFLRTIGILVVAQVFFEIVARNSIAEAEIFGVKLASLAFVQFLAAPAIAYLFTSAAAMLLASIVHLKTFVLIAEGRFPSLKESGLAGLLSAQRGPAFLLDEFDYISSWRRTRWLQSVGILVYIFLMTLLPLALCVWNLRRLYVATSIAHWGFWLSTFVAVTLTAIGYWHLSIQARRR